MKKSSDLQDLLFDLWRDLQDIRVLWQVAVIAAGLALAWWAGRTLQPRLARAETRWQLGVEGLKRAQFPLTALVVVLIGRAVLKQWQANVHLLNVAVPLLTALAIIRVAVYVLRHVFAPGGWLSASERVIAWVVWIGFALYITGLAPELLGFLDGLAFSAGKQRISALMIAQGVLSVAVTLLIALWIGALIERRVMAADRVDINLRVMAAKLVRAAFVLAAVLVALPAVGIDVTVLSVFGGAIGVGVGFGLQKIASNYVSGFIILMDRSVSIGDLITVDKYTGELTKMTGRYVVIRGLDGTESIIPNETIITSPVVNHSYTDRHIRLPVPVQVSYASDLEAAMAIMVEAAKRHPRVLAEPAPGVLIKSFGESGVDLELGVWLDDPERGQGNLRSDLYLDIWREFKARGIEIPYPRRDVHLYTAGAASRDAPQ